jgi:hypothetical protein
MSGISDGGAWAAVLPFVLAVIELLALFYVLRRAARQERAWTRALLAPEAEAGTIDPPLLDAVSGLRRDRKKYRKHLHSRSGAKHLIEATSDLAREIATAQGAETARVTHARSEVVRLRGKHPSQAPAPQEQAGRG